MATFKSLSKSSVVDGKYSARKRIYLESGDDQAIFKRWFFDEGEHLEFVSCNEGDGGGCTRVVGNVHKDRESGITSFGIVDRDALMQQQEWEVFWEDNDSVYTEKRPLGDYVHPLCRWEIENYVLDFDAFHSLLRDYGKYSPDGIDKTSLSDLLLRHSEALIPIMASNICLHEAGRPALPSKYAIQDSYEKANENCCKHLKKEGLEKSFKDRKDRLLSFKVGENPSEQYWQLNRMIDGKRLMDRLNSEFKLKEDHRFYLAKLVREKGKIAPEISNLIREIKGNA